MYKKSLILLFAVALIFSSNLLNAGIKTKVGEKIYISNPKNIEVICTLINLTDYWDKRHTDFPFSENVRENFLPYKEHKAVKMTADLLNKGWWQMYFFNIAVGITELPEGKPKFESRWFQMDQIKNYISLLQDFYKESNYEEFWTNNHDFYTELQGSIAKRYKEKDIDIVQIMEDFYGLKFDEYHIVPAPQLVDMGLHVEVNTKTSYSTFYFNGPLGKDKAKKEGDYFAPISSLIYTAFHEFGHSFLEPILQKNNNLLKKYSYIYENAKKGMAQKGYRSWDRVFIENLIHAVQICLMKKAWDKEAAEKSLEREYNNGYFLIKDMYEILQNYENNRDKYKSFEKFMLVVFEELGKKYKAK